ncbi:hypothetical protein DICPUDRAFT_97830 [Dictyostelium purpureum]|uniref:Terpene synthase 9 n=1 Tax=Dictyostelium purpureum TaxID=5786 RepID=TPS9_DICPU|nr:uncharacterized protein DICPUDRAFT_97830 [Dictyostelium purpureum]F0ZK52.1 RecName: Full=Terpene synthase 9 [Dictyostelium purpureum]AXN72978.1 terpene synthase [Dictyostelium purpureum]EGC35663.1 hypothetical protein DICPUDRAFT_97830 [Dictyostelium purpureum]|eukprot:XP_003287796.1 hypothetical protein DICPUDRAFT_97830 [Dictyostelium purpureum]
MSLSFKNIVFPEEWQVPPNDYIFIDDCYEEALQFNLFERGDEKSYTWMYHTISCCAYFWCKCSRSEMKLIGHLMLWTFLLDDILDSDKVNDAEAIEMIKRTEFIFIEGKLPENPTDLEKYTCYLRNEGLKIAGDREDMFNMFLTNSIQWILSIIPLNKSMEHKLPPHLQLHGYLRKLNVGVELCQGFTYLIFANNKVNPAIFNSPRYKKMLECTSMVVSHVNDMASYCKEVKNGGGFINSLLILQKRADPLSIEHSYQVIAEQTNAFIRDFIYQEKMLLESISDEQQNEVKVFLDHMKYLMKGNYLWSGTTARYASKSSPFVEMQKSLNVHLDNEIDASSL